LALLDRELDRISLGWALTLGLIDGLPKGWPLVEGELDGIPLGSALLDGELVIGAFIGSRVVVCVGFFSGILVGAPVGRPMGVYVGLLIPVQPQASCMAKLPHASWQTSVSHARSWLHWASHSGLIQPQHVSVFSSVTHLSLQSCLGFAKIIFAALFQATVVEALILFTTTTA
jgi:hypothetical protein